MPGCRLVSLLLLCDVLSIADHTGGTSWGPLGGLRLDRPVDQKGDVESLSITNLGRAETTTTEYVLQADEPVKAHGVLPLDLKPQE